jgi:D-alanyl-D-alanine carboxypeptidase
MKAFFYIVFGGLLTLGVGVCVARGFQIAWPAISSVVHSVKLPSVASVFTAANRYSSDVPLRDATKSAASAAKSVKPHATDPKIGDGTSISGMTRTVRYSASEEEDLIGTASLSLPNTSVKKMTAVAYVVKSIDSGDTPVEFNADKIVPIASLSKLVTAIVARQVIASTSRITVTRDIMVTYGNTGGFKIGETMLASDLYYPLLMVSSNDTAEAFAQFYGRTKFLQAMNDFTQSIGAYRTHFSDPSGLTPLNVSSANDLVIILKWIEKNDPEILAITKLKSKTVRSHTWVNPTHFLNWSNYAGGKNGYTDEANRTSATLFTMDHGSQTYAVIVLGSESRDADMVKLLAKIK